MQFKTFEAVGLGHPDRLADTIADMAVDHLHKFRRQGPAGIEVLASEANIFISGEIDPDTARFNNDEPRQLAKKVQAFLTEQGYEGSRMAVHVRFRPQSYELNESYWGIGNRKAGDNSIVVGYATDETPQRLPVGQIIANNIVKRVNEIQKAHGCFLDAKIMVELNDRVISDVWISCHVSEEKESAMRSEVLNVVKDCTKEYNFDYNHMDTKLTTYKKGGLHADTGVTNRKMVTTTYGPSVLCGGGGLHGKDMGKVDRLGFCYARWIAKCLVDTGFYKEIELQLIYSFGSTVPIIRITKEDTGPYKYNTPFCLGLFVNSQFKYSYDDLHTAFGVPMDLNYEGLARNGHFLSTLPWERTANKAGELLTWFKENKIFVI